MIEIHYSSLILQLLKWYSA